MIAELEDELSVFTQIAIDGYVVARDIELEKGDSLEFDAEGASRLELTGAYFPLASKLDFEHSALARNRIVCNFLATWNTVHSRKDYSALHAESVAGQG